MAPSVGCSKPPIIRSVVVLPQPDGPSSAKKLPRSISSERSSTATTSSNRLVNSASRTSGTRAAATGLPQSRSHSPPCFLQDGAERARDLVELLLVGDERRRDLHDRVAAVVGP